MKDFVSFETAKKLKEKGFKEQCLAYYTKDSNFYYNTSYGSDVENDFKSFNSRPNHICGKRIDAPTISQVLKWLREEKRLHIAIDVWGRTWGYDIIELTSDNSLRWTAYREDIKSYEDAALDGIEYAIDNLI